MFKVMGEGASHVQGHRNGLSVMFKVMEEERPSCSR